VTQTWRDTIDSDPLGLATRRQWEEPEPEHTPRRAGRSEALRLLVVMAAVVGLGFAAGYGETVLLIFVLIFCIIAHEFGHYVAAKTGGVKVTEFFVGFGPRLWSIKRGETEYGVKALPLGGYCRIIGMNNLEEGVPPADEARTYRHAPLYRRLLIDIAGPGINILIGFVILFAMFFWTGDSGNYFGTIPANNRIVQILAFTSGQSPAQQAGLKPGDRIEAIDGEHFGSWQDMGKFISASAGQRLDLAVNRGGKILQIYVTPVAADTVRVAGAGAEPGGKAGFIGIAVDPIINPPIRSGFTASVAHAGSAVSTVTTRTSSALGHLFTLHGISSYVHMLSSQQAADNPANSVRFSSPIKVVQDFNEATTLGLPTVLWLVGVINISIGLLNLLPIFPLDGGRVVVALYEGVRSLRRPHYRVDMARLLPALYAGLAFVIFLGITAIFLDLRDAVA
jgi:membrane-associated protease RseP (regulator of RpoE activity)